MVRVCEGGGGGGRRLGAARGAAPPPPPPRRLRRPRRAERRQMLDDAERLALECHRSMCRALEIHTLSAEQLCRSFLSRSKTTDTGFRRGLDELLDEYDDRCARLAVWYHAALEREQEIYRRRMEEESLACARLSHQVKESLRLSVFAIHLESETDSRILLKRLPSAHPQHVRCRRAASENIKPGFLKEPANRSQASTFSMCTRWKTPQSSSAFRNARRPWSPER